MYHVTLDRESRVSHVFAESDARAAREGDVGRWAVLLQQGAQGLEREVRGVSIADLRVRRRMCPA